MKNNKSLAAGLGLVLFPLILNAQSWTSKTPRADSLTSMAGLTTRPRLMTFKQMDQRKVYHWANGQMSTPTGRQAGERTSRYVMVFGDSAVIVNDPTRKK